MHESSGAHSILKRPTPTSPYPPTRPAQPPSRVIDFRVVTWRLAPMRHLPLPATPTIPLTRPPSPDSHNHITATYTQAYANERSFDCGKQDRAARHEVAKQGKKKHKKYDRANGYPFKHLTGAHSQLFIYVLLPRSTPHLNIKSPKILPGSRLSVPRKGGPCFPNICIRNALVIVCD